MDNKTKIKVGDYFVFKGQLIDGHEFISNNIKSLKVVSFFPKLNTSICDMQTLRMVEWSKQFPYITFISTSMDPIEVAQKWCKAHGISNLFFVSDQKLQDFANKTNLYLENKKMLKRGLMLIDADNKIIALTVNKDFHQEPLYEVIESKLINC